jgi:hypothetical protein
MTSGPIVVSASASAVAATTVSRIAEILARVDDGADAR